MRDFRTPSTEEIHHYESAKAFVTALARRIEHWKILRKKEGQPVAVDVLLSDGRVIHAELLSSEGHNNVVVEGKLDGRDCFVIAHQATIQAVCYAAPVGAKRKVVGFLVDKENDGAGGKS